MNTSDIQHKVLEEIHAGRVHMHSRAYFVARMAGMAGIAAAAFLIAIFFFSFVLFLLNESGELSLLTFGPRGFATFFSLVPWLIVAVVIALLTLLEFFLRSFKFGYNLPVLRVFAAVAVISAVVSMLVYASPLHSRLLDRADNDALPVIGALYKAAHVSHKEQGVFRGIVTSLASSSFEISHDDRDLDSDDGAWTVSFSGISSTSVPNVGDKVYVAGDVEGHIIRAYGVQRLPQRQYSLPGDRGVLQHQTGSVE